MDEPLRFTLVADGPTDRMLMPVLVWLLEQHSRLIFTGQFADLRWLPRPPTALHDRVRVALDLFPCELLFVHRDAEKADLRVHRIGEIELALRNLAAVPPAVHVVPVLMSEAWLLFDERAIRYAAGNPNGKIPLELPRVREVESIDAKDKLHQLLRTASGLKGHRLQKFGVADRVQIVAERVEDYSPLRRLDAFITLENELCRTLVQRSWR